uniref:C-type lectin domain family 14 member A n=1 Tax=Pogona vitticeps TaxID=103695 RepID=A0A6J0UXD8_9SAUR
MSVTAAPPIVEQAVNMRRLILASLVFLWPLTAPGGSAAEPHLGHRTWCDGSAACYSVHLGKFTFQRAKNACAEYGGGLSTASGRTEIQALLALLRGIASGSGARLFWLSLLRKAPQCTREDLPLRGFSWAAAVGSQESPANDTSETPPWVTEPVKSCTKQRCAGLSVTLGQPLPGSWGLREQACTSASSGGYICKYRSEDACPARHPPSGAHRLRYTLPHRLQSPAAEFRPPGTVLTLRCSPGQEARFVCRLSPDGYHWEGAGHGLCSCPSGLWSPTEGACVALGDCLSAQGAFLCLCSRGSRLEATEAACVGVVRTGDAGTARTGLSTPATTGAFGPNSTSPPSQNTSLEPFPPAAGNGTDAGAEEAWPLPASSNYVFILVTVAVVLLVILIMAALQVFQACFRVCCASKRSQAKKDSAPATAAEEDLDVSATRTHSEHSLGPSKAESREASPDDGMPGDGLGDFGQP